MKAALLPGSLLDSSAFICRISGTRCAVAGRARLLRCCLRRVLQGQPAALLCNIVCRDNSYLVQGFLWSCMSKSSRRTWGGCERQVLRQLLETEYDSYQSLTRGVSFLQLLSPGQQHPEPTAGCLFSVKHICGLSSFLSRRHGTTTPRCHPCPQSPKRNRSHVGTEWL